MDSGLVFVTEGFVTPFVEVIADEDEDIT